MGTSPFVLLPAHKLSRRELLRHAGISGLTIAAASLAGPIILPVAAAGVPDGTTQAQIKSVIEQYFTLKYETRGDNQTRDFEPLLADTPEARALGQAERTKRDLEAFQASLFDLRYAKYAFTLDYTDLTLNGDGTEATAQLRESNEVWYTGTQQSAHTAIRLPHHLGLKKVGGGWRIARHNYNDDWQRYLARGPLSEDQVKDRSKAMKEANEKEKARHPASTVTPMAPGDPRSYDVNGAVNYAYNWTVGSSGRNPSWGDYGPNEFINPADPGNDCTNFSSQCLTGGGCPLDPGGTYFWFWYSYSNFSGSFLSVTQQWDYLYNNGLPLPDRQGPGPWGQEVSVWDTANGDIVQFDYGQGDGWSHSPLIIRRDGVDLSQIGVAAHSYTVYNKAISDYPPTSQRWMHIKGYGSTS